MSTSGTPTLNFIDTDYTSSEFEFKKGTGNQPNFIKLNGPSNVFELGHPGVIGWLKAPFGLSAKFNESSRKQALQLEISDPYLLEALRTLDDYNDVTLSKNVKNWTGDAVYRYMPVLRTLDDGRVVANFKVTPEGNGRTIVWKTKNPCIEYSPGTVEDLNRQNGYALSFRTRGMWQMPGNMFGMSLEIMEIAANESFATEEMDVEDKPQPTTPALSFA